MLVKQRMYPDPFTIHPNTSVTDALNYIHERKIRRLPVVNEEGQLVGIVSEKDLLHASPSPVANLSMHESGYLLSRLKVAEIMTQKVLTIQCDAPLEEAAWLMANNKIGALPVMQGDKLVGILTDTDVFKTLVEMMGARQQGIRITIDVHNQPGVLGRITGAIAARGGDIIALGTFYGDNQSDAIVTIKIHGLTSASALAVMENQSAKVIDIRET